jgi:hypothetical protein
MVMSYQNMRSLNPQDCSICFTVFAFLSMPLLLLAAAATMIAL